MLKNGALISSFEHPLRSRYVRKRKTNANQAAEGRNPFENGSKQCRSETEKPLSTGKRVGILDESWLMRAIWEMSVQMGGPQQWLASSPLECRPFAWNLGMRHFVAAFGCCQSIHCIKESTMVNLVDSSIASIG